MFLFLAIVSASGFLVQRLIVDVEGVVEQTVGAIGGQGPIRIRICLLIDQQLLTSGVIGYIVIGCLHVFYLLFYPVWVELILAHLLN